MKPTFFDITCNSDESGSAFARVEVVGRPALRGVIIEDDSLQLAEETLLQKLYIENFGV